MIVRAGAERDEKDCLLPQCDFCLHSSVLFGIHRASLGILAPILWAVAATAFAVGTGWRHQNAAALKSAVVGLAFCLLVFIPLYFVGRWFS